MRKFEIPLFLFLSLFLPPEPFILLNLAEPFNARI